MQDKARRRWTFIIHFFCWQEVATATRIEPPELASKQARRRCLKPVVAWTNRGANFTKSQSTILYVSETSGDNVWGLQGGRKPTCHADVNRAVSYTV